MSSGHLYILSNPYLGADLLKIGLTTRDPAARAMELSKSTAIPGIFKVEFTLHVKDCKVAERRLHLLLKEHRVEENKEFFRLSVHDARLLCSAVGTFEDEEMPASDTLLVHADFYFTRIAPRLELHVLKALMYVLSATQHNTVLDHLLDERLLVVDGFTSATGLAEFRSVGVQSAAATLRRLARVAMELMYPICEGQEPIRLFTKFAYDRGHVAWKLDPAFRRLFIIPTAMGRIRRRSSRENWREQRRMT